MRQRIKFGEVALNNDDKLLESYGIQDGSDIILKDLGPQIGWKAVFLLEYLGPLLIHQLYYALHQHPLSFTQLMAYACVTFHFLKREYESIFVHRFSHNSMPLTSFLKNTTHYWLVCGVAVGYELYRTAYEESQVQNIRTMLWSVCFLAAEMGNLYAHVVLRRLRAHNPKARGIPVGFGFNLVSCPNYLFESLAWLSFAMMTNLYSAWFFLVLSTGQMYLWARKKHDIYKREFPHYPKNRTSMFPFLP